MLRRDVHAAAHVLDLERRVANPRRDVRLHRDIEHQRGGHEAAAAAA
jgi:hypothetical protein